MIDFAQLTYRVEPMRSQDLDQVMEIERGSFSAPWSRHAFDYELHYNEMAHYYIVRPRPGSNSFNPAGMMREQGTRPFWERWFGSEEIEMMREPIVGYGGFWKMVDEAHISTIAIAPGQRRQGIGELLLIAMIEAAQEIGSTLVTLEVRKSNATAQGLYSKYGFEIAGERKRYYSDNGEDAWIMTTPNITSAPYNRRLQDLKSVLLMRLSG
jgi:[ribosomal protein S18]-alanine N-acetyltransferase